MKIYLADKAVNKKIYQPANNEPKKRKEMKIMSQVGTGELSVLF